MSVNMEADTDKCVHANIENLETERNTAVSTRKGRNAYASMQKEMERNTVESINNDNCNNENTAVTRHFSIPVFFYPS